MRNIFPVISRWLMGLLILTVGCSKKDNDMSAGVNLHLQPAALSDISALTAPENWAAHITTIQIVYQIAGNANKRQITLKGSQSGNFTFVLEKLMQELPGKQSQVAITLHEIAAFSNINGVNAVYGAVPNQSSQYARLVKKPLPITITVRSMQIQQETLEFIFSACLSSTDLGFRQLVFQPAGIIVSVEPSAALSAANLLAGRNIKGLLTVTNHQDVITNVPVNKLAAVFLPLPAGQQETAPVTLRFKPDITLDQSIYSQHVVFMNSATLPVPCGVANITPLGDITKGLTLRLKQGNTIMIVFYRQEDDTYMKVCKEVTNAYDPNKFNYQRGERVKYLSMVWEADDYVNKGEIPGFNSPKWIMVSTCGKPLHASDFLAFSHRLYQSPDHNKIFAYSNGLYRFKGWWQDLRQGSSPTPDKDKTNWQYLGPCYEN